MTSPLPATFTTLESFCGFTAGDMVSIVLRQDASERLGKAEEKWHLLNVYETPVGIFLDLGGVYLNDHQRTLLNMQDILVLATADLIDEDAEEPGFLASPDGETHDV